MKRYLPLILFFLIFYHFGKAQKVYTTYLWHLQQPIYWPDAGQSDPYHYQTVKQSQDIKDAGGNQYGTGVSHPTNNLADIFGKDDRKNAYQHETKSSIEGILSYPDAGAQVNYSGCLIENVNSLADAGQWGYYSGWEQNYQTARGWQTSGGFPRMDIVGFTFHHALSPLVSERALTMEIDAHRLIYGNTFGSSPDYSQGYWPAECCFSERIIKVLSQEGFEWSVVANSHLARTLNDYPLHYGTDGCNISPPNGADVISTNGTNWWSGQQDGRGGTFAAPYCYQPHKAQYIDPETGTQYKITVVPMADLLSYKDGYAPMSTDDINTNITPYADAANPCLILLAHDGDNAYAGGYGYYHESVPNFVSAVNDDANMKPSTVQQFLHDHPVDENDIVHVEDGGWVNAANDWGHPQFINWLWPIYNNSTYEFNPDGWTEDYRNWAVITATDNFVCMAEDLAGSVDINDVVYPSASSSEAELAWHFYLPSLTSGYMYYGIAEDMEVKQTIAGNNAISHAQNVITAHSGTDNTPPSVFVPQRFPYNPGGREFGPIYGYQEHISSQDFTVWTLAYDVSGIQTAVLKYRTDYDGVNPLDDYQNDTYAGGSGVSAWNSINMTCKVLDSSYNAGNSDIDFFVLPDAMADLYYAEIVDLSDTLVDYYVEITDNKGNTYKTAIQHVYVGGEDSQPTSSYIYWTPENPTKNEVITIVDSQATANSFLHWGVTVDGVNWNAPIAAYQPAGTVAFDSHAVETPFTDDDNDGVFTVQIGPFNDASQVAEKVNFVVKVDASTWDNNGGSDYFIDIENNVSDNPVGSNQVLNLMINETHNFLTDDFYFQASGGATFAGIKIISVQTAGNLTYNGSAVSANQVCADISQLSFSPATDQTGNPYASFTFKVLDTQSRESDNDYTFTFNVFSYNPLSQDASVSMMQDTTYTFSESNFPFTGMNGASFAGIQLVSDVSVGTLLYNGSAISASTDYSDLTLLTFEPETGQFGSPYTSFNFKVKDNEGRYSNVYIMTINVLQNSQPSGVSWFPENPTSNDIITIFVSDDVNMTSLSMLHWGVNSWAMPNDSYIPANSTVSSGAAESPFFKQSDNLYIIQLGPFNNSAQTVNNIDFVLHYGGDSWNNNNNANWSIPITQAVDIKSVTQQHNVNIYPNPITSFATVDLTNEIGNFEISLININGEIMSKTQIIAPQKFFLSKGDLNAGIYFLKFVNTDKNEAFSKTVIIH